MTPVGLRIGRVRPLLMAVVLLAGWLLVAGAGVGSTALLTGMPALDPLPQAVGRMTATVAAVVLLWRLGLVRQSGVGRLGSPVAWAVAALAVVYLAPVSVWGFFGARGFAELQLVTPASWGRELAVQASVGTAEEILFRGLLLVVLVRAWGRTARGLATAALATAVLFALPHGLAAVGGAEPGAVTLNLVGTVLSGFWWAVLVLAFGTVWPGVVIHAITNAVVLVVPVTATQEGQLLAMLLEAPWILFGVWLLVRMAETPARAPDEARPDAVAR